MSAQIDTANKSLPSLAKNGHEKRAKAFSPLLIAALLASLVEVCEQFGTLRAF